MARVRCQGGKLLLGPGVQHCAALPMNMEGVQGQGAPESSSCTVGGCGPPGHPLGQWDLQVVGFLDNVRWYNVQEVESRWCSKNHNSGWPRVATPQNN